MGLDDSLAVLQQWERKLGEEQDAAMEASRSPTAWECKKEACWGTLCEDGRVTLQHGYHKPQSRRDARLPATMVTPPHRSASPRRGSEYGTAEDQMPRPRRDARHPATMVTPPHRAASPRHGGLCVDTLRHGRE